MGTKLARGRPVTRPVPPVHASGPLGHMNVRRACEAACVPLRDAENWPLSDEQVVIAVEAARDGASLTGGAEALRDVVAVGHLGHGSRILMGRPSYSELLVLASILRSPAADGVVS